MKPGESYNFTTRSINFLDLTIWIEEAGYIQTTLYSKPCRVISYLLPSSSHPSNVSKNIPFSLAYSLKRIELDPENLGKNLATLKTEFVSRGYRPRSIQDAFDRVLSLKRDYTLLDKKLPDIVGLIRHQCLLYCDDDFLQPHQELEGHLDQGQAPTTSPSPS